MDDWNKAQRELRECRDRLQAAEQDAARHDYVRYRVRGRLDEYGEQFFALPTIVPLGDIMRGSVAEHFDSAIDAARALAAKGELTP